MKKKRAEKLAWYFEIFRVLQWDILYGGLHTCNLLLELYFSKGEFEVLVVMVVMMVMLVMVLMMVLVVTFQKANLSMGEEKQLSFLEVEKVPWHSFAPSELVFFRFFYTWRKRIAAFYFSCKSSSVRQSKVPVLSGGGSAIDSTSGSRDIDTCAQTVCKRVAGIARSRCTCWSTWLHPSVFQEFCRLFAIRNGISCSWPMRTNQSLFWVYLTRYFGHRVHLV